MKKWHPNLIPVSMQVWHISNRKDTGVPIQKHLKGLEKLNYRYTKI